MNISLLRYRLGASKMGNLLTATLPCALQFSLVMLSASASLESSQSTLNVQYEEFDNSLNECQVPALKDRCSPTAVCDLTKDFCYEADHPEFSSCKSCFESCSHHPDHTAYKERCQGPPCEYYQYNICHTKQKETLKKLFKRAIENAPEESASWKLKVSIAFNVILLVVLSIVILGVFLRCKCCPQNTTALSTNSATSNEQAVNMSAVTVPDTETRHLLAGGDATLTPTANPPVSSTNGFNTSNTSNGDIVMMGHLSPDGETGNSSHVSYQDNGDPSGIASHSAEPISGQECKGPFRQPEEGPMERPHFMPVNTEYFMPNPVNTETSYNGLDQPLSLHSSESMMSRGPPTGIPVVAEHQAHGGDDNVDLVKPHDGHELHVGPRGHYEREAAYQPSDNQSGSTTPKRV